MSRYEVIQHKGVEIVLVDVSNSTPQQAIDAMADASKKIGAFPPKSVRLLTIATNAVYSKESVNALKDFATHNTPFIKASAVVGANGLRAVAVRTAAMVTGRAIKTFDTRELAVEWLAGVN